MGTDNLSFPGWAGPIVGAVVGVGIGFTRGVGEGPGVSGICPEPRTCAGICGACAWEGHQEGAAPEPAVTAGR